MNEDALAEAREVTLLDLLDRVIDHGVVLSGDITISVADVDLIYLGLRVMLASVEQAQKLGLGPETTGPRLTGGPDSTEKQLTDGLEEAGQPQTDGR